MLPVKCKVNFFSFGIVCVELDTIWAVPEKLESGLTPS